MKINFHNKSLAPILSDLWNKEGRIIWCDHSCSLINNLLDWNQQYLNWHHSSIHTCMSSQMQVENFTKSPESPYVKARYKMISKRQSLRFGSITMGYGKSFQNDRVSECPYVKAKYKIIWKRLCLWSVSMSELKLENHLKTTVSDLVQLL